MTDTKGNGQFLTEELDDEDFVTGGAGLLAPTLFDMSLRPKDFRSSTLDKVT